MNNLYRHKFRHGRTGEWRYFGSAADGKGFEYSTYEEAEKFLSQQTAVEDAEYGIDKILTK